MKIIIIDDDCLVTEALKTILQINADVEVVAGGGGSWMAMMHADYTENIGRMCF